MMICPTCQKPQLTERPHVHQPSLKPNRTSPRKFSARIDPARPAATPGIAALPALDVDFETIKCPECDAQLLGTGTIEHDGNGLHTWRPAATTTEGDFDAAMAAYDRLINDKALQQELLDAGLLVRVDPETGKPLAASQPSPSAPSNVGAAPAAATDSDRLTVDVDAGPYGVTAFQQLANQATIVNDSSEDASKGLHADKYQAVTAQPSPSEVPEAAPRKVDVLRAAAQEVLAADGAAESGDDGADQRWDLALDALRRALASSPVAPTEGETR